MPKPTLIDNPKRVTLYLPNKTVDRGRAIAAQSGQSLSSLVSELLSNQAAALSKVRVHADFSNDEFEVIQEVAREQGMTVEDLVKTATYSMLDSRPPVQNPESNTPPPC